MDNKPQSTNKIGIVTLTGGSNYGNKLQHYAVTQILQGYGYQCDTVRDTTVRGFATPLAATSRIKKLRPSYVSGAIRARLWHKYYRKDNDECVICTVRRANKNRAHYKELQQKRKAVFDAFTDEFLPFGELTVSSTTHADVAKVNEYAAFVCGSDQVWNPIYPMTSPVNFLTFAPEYKRVALSPSFGVTEIPPSRVAAYTQMLKAMPHLCTREQQGAQIIKKLTGRNVSILVDPTVMLSANEWTKLEKKPIGLDDKPFLLTYFLGSEDKEYKKQINSIASKRGLKIINLVDITDDASYLYGPKEFLYLLHHADFVCTDSFHGTVFSILFKRDFWVFARSESGFSKDNRAVTLLKKLCLEDSLYQKGKSWSKPDYARTFELIDKERKAFDEYLKNALKDACGQRPQRDYLNVEDWNEEHGTHCTGCSACLSICPKGCITMAKDNEGFLYPHVEQSSCIHCRACLNTCLASENMPKSPKVKALVMQNRNDGIRTISSSGGVFYELAKVVIDKGGVVFGVRLNEANVAVHCSASTMSELMPMLGSKYVQSEIGDTFAKARDLLQMGKTVLYSGTPCQIAGLKAFLRKDYANLLAVDIICHGTPSNKAWQAYLKAHKPIKNASFRNKDKGWAGFSMKLEHEKGFYRKNLETDAYLYAFLHNLNLRRSCYDCRFKTVQRCSDLTLGDFWGVDRVIKGWNDDMGTSLVLVQSDKGQKLLEQIDCFRQDEVEVDAALRWNTAAKQSVLRPNARDDFYNRLDSEPFGQVCPKIKKSQIRKIKERLYKLKNRRKA